MENESILTWVDSHCHLDDPQFDEDRSGVMERARAAGVGFVLTLGSDILSSRKGVHLAQSLDGVYAGVGVHPHNAKTAGKRTYASLTKLAGGPKVVAIGEVGLDHYRDHSSRKVQEEVFRAQIGIARKVGRPLVLHERNAHEELIRILQEERAWEVGGVIHCFSGGPEEVADYLDLGLYISLAGPVTFSVSTQLRETVREIPPERLLIETDAPYLTPAPFRGRRPNEPALVVHVAEKVAELLELPLEDLARITGFNAHALFGVPSCNTDPRIVYEICGALHVNLTYNCTNRCFYCPRFSSDFHYGHNLKLEREPSADEVWEALQAFGGPQRHVTFSGYGEPCLRLDVLKETARRIKAAGGTVRVLTNGHGNLIHGRNILPELQGLVDQMRISLHAETAQKYQRLAAPDFGEETFDAVRSFILEAKKHIPHVRVVIPNRPMVVDVEELDRMVTEELGVEVVRREFAVLA